MTPYDEELLNQLMPVFHRVINHFVAIRDHDEHWQMPPDNYTGIERISDDCDGFCLACRYLLRQKGIASRLVYCVVDRQGHLVVEASGWILDNRQTTVVANSLLNHYQWRRISGYEPGEPWREILPW